MPLIIPSRAKLNLYLRVMHPRPDGYHEIRTIFQTISLADRISLASAPDDHLELDCRQPDIPLDETNLCLRAARLLRERTGSRRGAAIFLEKNIPPGGGMGGGSSNAAMVLLGLNRLWELSLPLSSLMECAARLGADVPFFLIGGTALGTGRGDEIIPLPDLPPRNVLLALPGITVNTPRAYSRLNFLLTKTGWNAKMPPLHGVFLEGAKFLQQGQNDFEAVVFEEHPVLPAIKQALIDAGAETALMSGSGSTIFGIFDSDTQCQQAGRLLRERALPAEWRETRFMDGASYRQGLPPI